MAKRDIAGALLEKRPYSVKNTARGISVDRTRSRSPEMSGTGSVRALERQLHTELRLTGHIRKAAASYQRRDRGACGSEASWAVGGCTCGAAVRSRIDDRRARARPARDRKIGMVENVKDLGSDLEGDPFPDPSVLGYAD